ncbi:amidohydrolase family protein [Sphingomonas flavalba]|uniref:amidohydrolase family protein n=1 Tax=Sphingomonas flavalba TaxID=2559804 RepID=UPI0039E1443D
MRSEKSRIRGVKIALLSMMASVAFGGAAAIAADPPGAMQADPIPNRTEGVGPYNRVILRNVYYIDGTGAPAQGPADIVLSGDKIAEIKTIGAPGAINPNARAAKGDYEVDLTGHYVMPGFVDAHVHLHTLSQGQNVPSEYILKLWMGHGITTARDLGSGGPIEWLKAIKERSARNEIVAPRLHIYPFFHDIRRGQLINDATTARATIQEAKRRGADGIKFIGGAKDVLFAAIDEANKIDLRTTMHHAQPVVAYANVLDTSAQGLESMEHWYGLPEAMFTDKRLQAFPNDFINNDEMMRFGEAGRLWEQAARPGSDKWNEVMDKLLERDFALVPTMTAYLTGRDFMRMSRAEWHAEYTMPALWDFYRPSRINHGAYWFDWTSDHEMAWKKNYQLWMKFLNDYKNKGGKVAVGSDSGYIYNLYGFGYIQEMMLLLEAGFSSLEVIHAATQVGAQVLGVEDQVGTIRVGRKADLVVVKGNPLANLKLLFGTGTIKLNDDTGKVDKVGGVSLTIKDGIIYDAAKLRADVREMVARQKTERGMPQGVMTIHNGAELP